MAMTDDDLHTKITALADRQAITDQCHRYCRALDRVDEVLLRSIFHPDSTHRHGGFEGSSSLFCTYAIAVLAELDRTQHQLGNVLIDLAGDAAHVESYFTAYHRLPKGRPCTGVFERHDTSRDEDVWIGGRYIDRFERRGGVWRIAHRTGIHDWESWREADERHFGLMGPDMVGRRDRSDPVYTQAIQPEPAIAGSQS